MVSVNVPDADLTSDFMIVQATHLDALAEKADVVLPMAALYERGGTIISLYGKQKVLAPVQDPQGVAKDGADIAAELSLSLSKTKGFTQKDAIADAKKAKAPKLAAAAFNPVAAKAGKPASESATALTYGSERRASGAVGGQEGPRGAGVGREIIDPTAQALAADVLLRGLDAGK